MPSELHGLELFMNLSKASRDLTGRLGPHRLGAIDMVVQEQSGATTGTPVSCMEFNHLAELLRLSPHLDRWPQTAQQTIQTGEIQ